jgi:hypothetical protein
MKDRRPEPVPLAAHLMALAEAVNTGRPVPTGRLFGLPELPDNDYWVDIAGAAAVTGVPPNTITSWLARGGPTRNPFPAPRRHLYRLYWPCTEISMWQAKRRLAGDNPLYHPARCRSPTLPSGPCQVTSNECPRPSPWPRPARARRRWRPSCSAGCRRSSRRSASRGSGSSMETPELTSSVACSRQLRLRAKAFGVRGCAYGERRSRRSRPARQGRGSLRGGSPLGRRSR